MLGNSAFAYRLPEGSSVNDMHRRSAFFAHKTGLQILGTTLKGVVPIYRIVPIENLVAELKRTYGSQDGLFEECVASRMFFLFDHGASKVAGTLQKIKGLSLSPRVICTGEDARSLRGAVEPGILLHGGRGLLSRDAILLVYVKGLSERSLSSVCSSLTADPEALAHLLSLLTGNVKDLKFTPTDAAKNNFFCTAESYPTTKPLYQSFLDSVLHMEKWDLLSAEEQGLRCISSILLFPIIAPIAIFQSFRTPSRTNPNLTRWQQLAYKRAVHAKAMSVLDGAQYESQKPIVGTVANPILVKHGMLSAGHLTERARYVSSFHNLMGLERFRSVPKYARVCRVVFAFLGIFSAIFSAQAIGFSNLPVSIELRFFSIASAVCLACAFVAASVDALCRGSKKDKAIVLPLSFLAIAYAGAITCGSIYFGHHPITRLVLLCCSIATVFAVTLCTIAGLSMSAYHQKDLEMSSAMGLGITSYLEVKPRLIRELERPYMHDEKLLSTHAYLHALQVGQGNVDRMLIQDVANAAGDTHPPQDLPKPNLTPTSVDPVIIEEVCTAASTAL